MAYRKHFLLAWGGTLHGSEIWSNSVRMARPLEEPLGPPDDATMEDALDDVTADIRNFISTGTFHGQLRLTWVKFNRINSLGLYEQSGKTYERILTGAAGFAQGAGQSTTYNVPQASVAVSLRTARDRGVGSAGRFFLPGVAAAASVASDGRLTTAQQTSLNTAVQAFLNNLNNWPLDDAFWGDAGSAPRLVIASPGGRNHPEGLNEPVTQAGVGRVVDTQRRRRNDLSEELATLAIT